MNQEQPRLNIDLTKTQEVVCDKCGSKVFQEGLMLRKASKFLTGTTQDALIPLPVFNCAACGYVNEEFLPEPLKNKDSESI
jgi:DNA-directed RNA polymerase subunit RPC12/RpoP